VRIELYGGWHQYGVQAVPADNVGYASSVAGDVQLIPRLWLYDDHYDKNPKYREWIDALIEKRGEQGKSN